MSKTDNTTATTEQVATFDMVKGTYSPSQANDVLKDMIQQKINFHNRLIFGTWERFGDSCPASEKRLTELRSMRSDISHLVEQAKEQGLFLEVDCEMSIRFTDKAPNC